MLGYQIRPFVRQRVPLMRLIIRRKWLFLALALLPVIAACWGIAWLTPKLKARQSGEFLKVAESYLNTGKTRDAVISLNSSLRLMPDNPAALRLLAKIQTAQGGPVALDTWGKLLATGKVQLEDLIMCAQVAANQQDWALADRLAAATAITGNKGLPHLIRARLLRLKGDPSLIEAELRQAVEKDETLLSKRALAELLLSQRLNETKSKEAFEILREISAVQDASGAEALASALFKGVVPPDEIPGWIAAIRAHPDSNQRLLCVADYTESLCGLASHDVVVAKLHARVEKAPVKDRAEAMEWLFRMGEPELAAKLLSPSEAQLSESSYTIWLDANSQIGNLPMVLKSLDDTANPIKEGYLIQLYKAGAYVSAGRLEEAAPLFSSAFEHSKEDKEKFLKCLALLNISKRDDLFEKGLEKVLSDSSSAADCFKALLPSTYLRRDSAATLRYYELAAQFSPKLAADIALQNDLLYLKILMGRQEDVEKAAALSQANPMDQSLRITHAFAVFKAGDPAGAMKILKGSEKQMAAITLLPHEKAVVAAILTANDRTKEAELVARMIQPNQLSVQEIQLVQNSFASRKQALAPNTSAQSSSPKAANKPKR
jgi:tetratricopeptide (TPR) repeat protein